MFFEINFLHTRLLVAGETVEEQRKKMQTVNIAQPTTNVIVQPPKVSFCEETNPEEVEERFVLLHGG